MNQDYKKALQWTGIWISAALIFNVGLYVWKGSDIAGKFLTGYLLEKSLSVDNLFVFLLIFTQFKIPQKYQPRILGWGVVGALLARAIFIFGGISLLNRFHFVVYGLAAILVFSGSRLLFGGKSDNPLPEESSKLQKWLYRYFPVWTGDSQGKFFLKQSGKLKMTTLFAALIAVELTDVLFAMDSIPAILAVSTNPLVVYSPNIFAILGLRTLYFVVAGAHDTFHYLHYGLGLILILIGLKMIAGNWVHIPTVAMLVSICAILLLSMFFSWRFRAQKS